MKTPATGPLRLQLGVIKAAVMMMGLSLGLATQVGYAEESSDGPARTRMESRAGEHCPNLRDGRNRLEGLHKELALNGEQESLWQTARDASDKLRKEHGQRQSVQESLRKSLDAKTAPDLRALTAEMDKLREARDKEHKAVREAWLKFYDTLNEEQKQKASHFLLDQVAMMGQPLAGRRHSPGQRNSSMRQDKPTTPPR